jgi:hypothetical protein
VALPLAVRRALRQTDRKRLETEFEKRNLQLELQRKEILERELKIKKILIEIEELKQRLDLFSTKSKEIRAV